MVQGGMSCIKYLMFVCNFVFVICAIALITVGAIAQAQGTEYTAFLGSKYVTAPIIVIAVGCIIFLLAFLGCCGAVKENHCMVCTYGALLFILIVVQIAGGITAYVYRGQVEEFLRKNMLDTLNNGKNDTNAVWDDMQSTLHCCGVDGPADYKGNLRQTCCKKPLPTTCTEPDAFKAGCYGLLKEKVMSVIAIVGGVAIGIGVVELMGVIFAYCLAAAIKKEYEGV